MGQDVSTKSGARKENIYGWLLLPEVDSRVPKEMAIADEGSTRVTKHHITSMWPWLVIELDEFGMELAGDNSLGYVRRIPEWMRLDDDKKSQLMMLVKFEHDFYYESIMPSQLFEDLRGQVEFYSEQFPVFDVIEINIDGIKEINSLAYSGACVGLSADSGVITNTSLW